MSLEMWKSLAILLSNKKQMKKLFFYALCVAVLSSCTKPEKKDQVFEKIWKATGGKSTFEKSRFFEFEFAVERDRNKTPGRKHLWDRYTGDYRLESVDASGAKTVTLFNVNTKQGKAFVNGVALDNEQTSQAIQTAYAKFINDSYWLMVPLKLQDEGVNTELEPDTAINDVKCNVIHLNFDKVGLTPGDQYWLFVNDNTGEVVQWTFLLQHQQKPATFTWAPYQDLGGGLKLSTKKTNTDGKTTIYYPVAKVLTEVDKTKFTQP